MLLVSACYYPLNGDSVFHIQDLAHFNAEFVYSETLQRFY